jgi:nickel/cobalt transporter (NicO) family protein
MRRLLLALLGALALAALGTVPVFAHPLGNFTVNQFSRLEVNGDRLTVLQVVDYAEFPAFQARQQGAGTRAYDDRLVGQVAGALHLTVDGDPEPLRPGARSLRFLPGQGGLDTMRLELRLDGPRLSPGSHAVTFRDAFLPERLGWREIVATAGGGASLPTSSVPATSASHELRAYPNDLLKNPLHAEEARLTVTPGVGAAQPAGFEPIQVTRGAQDRFADLISTSGGVAAVGLAVLVAIVLGALHALEPGHGKAVMAGYLVGTRGTPRHAVLLALSITVTHTVGVFLLGLVVLLAAQRLAPERLYPWLSLLSGLLVLGVGASLVVGRLRGRRAGAGHDHGHHRDDEHGHDHEHGHHRHRSGGSSWSAVLLGISGGVVPCPSALVVLLAAVSLHRVGFGLALIVAFSAGLALTLTGVGLAFAGGRSTLRRLRWRPRAGLARRVGHLVPVASALLVMAAGAAMAVQAVGSGL